LVGLQRNQTTLLVWQQQCSRFFNNAGSEVCGTRDIQSFPRTIGLTFILSSFEPIRGRDLACWPYAESPTGSAYVVYWAEPFLTGSWVSPRLLPALCWLLELPSRYLGPAGRFLVLFPLFTLHSLKGFLPKLREQGYSGIVCLVTRPSISFHKMLDKLEKVFDINPVTSLAGLLSPGR
jgi:hypothetical protein